MEVIQQYRTLFILESIAFIILGALAIALPGLMTLTIELFIGWLFIFGGLIQGYRALKTQPATGFYPSLISAALSIVVGALLLVYPITGVYTLTLLLISFFIIEGISKMIFSWQMKPLKGWGWLLVSGILALLMAGILVAGWPGTAVWGIGLLVGINMIFFGGSLLTLALGVEKK